jgi:hypothetical protein
MAKRKLTTSVDETTYKELRRLKREGLNASDVLAIAVEIARENPELFYAVAWKLKHAVSRP